MADQRLLSRCFTDFYFTVQTSMRVNLERYLRYSIEMVRYVL